MIPEIVQEIGAVAGIAAFLGISVLAILQFIQARDVRRLRDWAGRAPERDAEFQEATSALAATRAEELRAETGDLPHGDPFEAEARAIQLRAARQRNRDDSGGAQGRLASSRPLQALVGLIAVAVVAGATYVAVGQISGDEDEPTRQNAREQRNQRGGGGGAGAIDPSQVQVAVLNGTAASGLATAFQDGISSAGYQVGAVGNSQSTFAESTARAPATGVLRGSTMVASQPSTGRT